MINTYNKFSATQRGLSGSHNWVEGFPECSHERRQESMKGSMCFDSIWVEFKNRQSWPRRIKTRAEMVFVVCEGRVAANLPGEWSWICSVFWLGSGYVYNCQNSWIMHWRSVHFTAYISIICVFYLCRHAHVCAIVSMCTWKPENNLGCPPQAPSTFISGQGLSLGWNSLSRLSCWPVSPRDPSFCLHLPSIGITSTYHHALFNVDSEVGAQVSVFTR